MDGSSSTLTMPSSPVKPIESSIAVRKILQEYPEELNARDHDHNHQSGSRCSRCGRQKDNNGKGGSCNFCRVRGIAHPPTSDDSVVTVEPIYDVTNSISINNDFYEEAYVRNGKRKSSIPASEVPRIGRKWQYFPGKNKFYCEGRVMTAPSIRFCVLSFGLIIVTFVLFIIFDGPYLAEKLTLAIPIVGALLFLSVVVNMLKTSCSDPGILPRASQQESEYIEKSYGDANNSRPPPRTKDIVVNGQTVKSKYCFTCKMFRPPRASHCGVCDNCVDRFDHHCPFLGNCIGKRNYRSFYAFIVSLSLLAVFVLSCSITHLALLSKETGNFLDALRDSPTSAVVVLISFFGMWTVIGLAGFHTYLIAMEQTTNEDIKGMFGRANSKNPYSRGNFCQNCCFVLCGPAHPSLLDPRGYATLDFLASLPRVNETTGTSGSNKCGRPASIKANCSEVKSGGQSHVQSPSGPNQASQMVPMGAPIYTNKAANQHQQGMPISPSGAHISNLNGKMMSPNSNAQTSSNHMPSAVSVGNSGEVSGKFPTYLRDTRQKAVRNHIETVPTLVHQPLMTNSNSGEQAINHKRMGYSGPIHIERHGSEILSGSGSSTSSSPCEHSNSSINTNGHSHNSQGHVSLSMVKLNFDTQRRSRDGASTSSSGTNIRDPRSYDVSTTSIPTVFQKNTTKKDVCPHVQTKNASNNSTASHAVNNNRKSSNGRLENQTMINSPLHLDTIM